MTVTVQAAAPIANGTVLHNTASVTSNETQPANSNGVDAVISSAPVLVLGIAVEARSRRQAYLGLTRVKAVPPGEVSVLSVLNASLAEDSPFYDALLVADEVHDFGRYVLYNTWQARPVAGSEGLSAVTWSPVIEQWGAAQLQSRFEETAGRGMQPQDYAAWAFDSVGMCYFLLMDTIEQDLVDYLENVTGLDFGG